MLQQLGGVVFCFFLSQLHSKKNKNTAFKILPGMSDVFTLLPTEFGESLVENFQSALWLALGRRRAARVAPHANRKPLGWGYLGYRGGGTSDWSAMNAMRRTFFQLTFQVLPDKHFLRALYRTDT